MLKGVEGSIDELAPGCADVMGSEKGVLVAGAAGVLERPYRGECDGEDLEEDGRACEKD